MTTSPRLGALRRFFGLLMALMIVGGLTAVFSLSFSTRADAAELPSPPPLLQRNDDVVTADPLPTVQIDNGYVWAQTTIGSTVYAVGDFDNARAPSAAPGTQLTPRSNILAYDINTGSLLPFAPQVNGVIKAVAASPDGSRIYIGGSFTSVNGQTRWNMAALDAATGQLVPGFQPAVGGAGVYALVAHGSTVYAGGLFTQGNGAARQNAAAFSASNGALMPWAPQTDKQIDAMVADPGGEKIILGGRFSAVNGNTEMRGVAAIDDQTGAVDAAWELPQTVKNGRGSGANAGKAGIFALAADEDAVYGTGWVFADVTTGNLEGTFAAEAGSGEVRWIADCLGDHYGVYSTGTTVYTTSHTHACSTMGLHPEQSRRSYRYVEAYTTDVRGTLGHNPHAGGTYQDWFGTPAPSAYAWYPDFYTGTTSGLGQAGLSITGVGDIISVAGEFVGVNNQRYEGIVRFSTAPPQGAKDGPRLSGSSWQPTAHSFMPGRVRVAIPGNWDRDDLDLTYELRRAGTNTPVDTTTASSTWWKQPGIVLEDTTAPPGSTPSYTVVVRDGDGNAVTSQPVTTTVASGTISDYATAVIDAAPQHYYPLGDTMQDWAGANPAVAGNGVSPGTPGIEKSSTGYSGFNGSSSGRVVTSSQATVGTEFSTELWFRTTTRQGGKLIGYGSSASGDSSNYDRHVYMTNSGEVVFGVYPGSTQTIRSSAGFNDSQWHHVVASQSAAGIELYVDGDLVAENAAVTTAQSYSGYWRIGGDNLNSWPDAPSSYNFDGAIDEVAIYDRALDPSEVTTHFGIGTGFEAPTASFSAAVEDLGVTVDAQASSAHGGATLEQYRWDFGDGSPEASGETATHTYAATGTYTVTLTVVDSNGLSSTSTQSVTVQGPNLAPTAQIETSAAGLTVTADGSGSTDPDGEIVSYDWDWGDGESSEGATASHAYAAAGFYTVTLTVTDDRGGTAEATERVTATHADPAALFTASATGLTVNADASESSAADGASLSYSWDWGDGTTSSQGPTASHSYSDDGDFEITLTVTDSLGSTAESTQPVTVTGEVFVASDSFERSVSGGWGSADVGGAWTSSGWGSSATSVGDGVGSMVLAPGAGLDMLLAETSLTDSGTSLSYTLEGGPSTGSLYFGVKSRYDADGHAYRSLVWHRADGSVWLVVQRDGTVLKASRVSGMQWAAGSSFRVRSEVVGEDSATLRMKIWAEGTAEPAGWQLETTDPEAEALTGPGASSVYLYRSGSSTGQIPVRVDDYQLTNLGDDELGVQRAAAPQAAGELAEELPAPDSGAAGEAQRPGETAVDEESVPTAADDAAPHGEGVETAEDPAATGAADDGEEEPDAEDPETTDAGSGDAEAAQPEDESGPDSPTAPDGAPAADPQAPQEPTVEDPTEDPAPTTPTRIEDDFERSVDSGWGGPEHGDEWSLTEGSEAALRVTDGSGTLELAPDTSATVVHTGPSLSAETAELTFRVEEDGEPGGTQVGVVLGRTGDSQFSLEASMRPDGSIWLMAYQDDELVAEQQVDGLNYGPGTTYTLTVSLPEQAGSSVTAKLWETADEEPADWQLSVDGGSLSSISRSGSVGVTAARQDGAGGPAVIALEEFAVTSQG